MFILLQSNLNLEIMVWERNTITMHRFHNHLETELKMYEKLS